MKKIKLTKGQFAVVDDEDFKWLNQWKWYANKARNGDYYVQREEKDVTIIMHRIIMNTPKNRQTDHINHNTLDNRKENLRVATRSQNQRNSGLCRKNTSGYKGVYWNKRAKKWMARIVINRKGIYIGYFDDIKMAAKAYDNVAIKCSGEFAFLNLQEE